MSLLERCYLGPSNGGQDPHFTDEGVEAQGGSRDTGREGQNQSEHKGRKSHLSHLAGVVGEIQTSGGHSHTHPDQCEDSQAQLSSPAQDPLTACQRTRCLMAAITFCKSWDGRDCFRNASNFVFNIKIFTIFRP